MKIKTLSILALSAAFILSACGEAPKKEEEKEMTHDEMHEEGVAHDDDHEAMVEAAEEAEALPIPEGARVYFVNVKDGQKVTSPVKLVFGVEGMEVEPAGDLNENKGHHHVIVDGGALERGTIVPTDEKNIHFGKGQTETELELSKGEHTLTLQFADGYHQSYGEQLSNTITVTVQ